MAECDRQAEPLGEQFAQGYVAPAEVRRVDGEAALRVDDAGDGDSGGGGALAQVGDAVGAEVGGEAEDRLDHGVGAALAAGRSARLVEQSAVRPDEGGFHRGAAHVEGDDMSHGDSVARLP